MQGAWGRGRWIAICALAASFALGANAQSEAAEGPPLITQVVATAVSQNAATLSARIDPSEKVTSFSFEYGLEDCETSSCAKVAEGSVSVPTTEKVTLEGLDPGTLYHYRVTAENSKGKASSGDRVFATRSGIFSGLPDNRSYEQASPTDKDGGDLQGYIPLIKAAESGGGITFESTFGVPGGKGAQEFPTYFASRGQSSWSTDGLLPPFSAGQLAQVMGWSPDFTEVFSKVFRLGEPREGALVMQKGSAPPVTVAPYTPRADYFYVGQSEDGSVVLFESSSKLTGDARAGLPNVYAWDRETGNLTLAGTYNDKTAPPKGTFAGAYWWPAGSSGRYLSLGGAERGMYLRDEHAVSDDGSVVFTEAATGQLYRRINPTAEQSPVNGEGECQDPAKACTIHISASHKSDGKGEGGTDAAGPQAAAFQAASKDGSEVLFTSPEMLTNDANTGPEQSPAQIEEGNTSGAIENPKLVPLQRALGVAVDSEHEHLYWVNPATQAIDRSGLDGKNKEPAFVVPGPIECEVKGKPGSFEEVESTPRYLAVQGKYLYWTNTGCSDEFGPLKGTGTIGRADIGGATATDIRPDLHQRRLQPAGDRGQLRTHLLGQCGWERRRGSGGRRSKANKSTKNSSKPRAASRPYGVALSSTRVYFSYESAKTAPIMQRGRWTGGGAEIPLHRQRRDSRRRGRLRTRLLGLPGRRSDRAGRPRTGKQRQRIHQAGRQTDRAGDKRHPPLLVEQRRTADQPRQRPLPLRPRKRRAGRPDARSETATGPKCRACWAPPRTANTSTSPPTGCSTTAKKRNKGIARAFPSARPRAAAASTSGTTGQSAWSRGLKRGPGAAQARTRLTGRRRHWNCSAAPATWRRPPSSRPTGRPCSSAPKNS